MLRMFQLLYVVKTLLVYLYEIMVSKFTNEILTKVTLIEDIFGDKNRMLTT